MGFREIERSTGVNHNTVIGWVKKVGKLLPNAPIDDDIPELAQIDELQTFVGSKKNLDGNKREDFFPPFLPSLDCGQRTL